MDIDVKGVDGRKVAVLLLAVACLLLFAHLMGEVLEGEAMRIDAIAYTVVVKGMRSPAITPTMEAFSDLASVPSLIVVLLAIAAFAPGRRPGLCCTVNLVLVVVLNQAIKMLVQRPRPVGFRLAAESGFSFPSGHSMVAMAFFGLIIWLIWRYERDRRMRLALTAAFSIVIVMIGVSRVYLGVHYASDVLGGFCLSLAWLVLYTRFVAPAVLGDTEKPGR